MSFEEKSVWIQLLVTLGVFAAYAATVLGHSGGAPLSQAAYQRPLITAIVAGIATALVLQIAVAIASRECRKDERDVQIRRRGDAVGGSVFCAAALVPLGLAMAGLAHFWIANSLYIAMVVGGVATECIKLLGYRRGL